MQAHKLSETLLSQQPLCLQIALLCSFSGQYLGPKIYHEPFNDLLFDLSPPADPELHKCDAQTLTLLHAPPG